MELLHPLAIFFAASFALTLTAAYTDRHSPLRYGTLAFLAICAAIFPRVLISFAQSHSWLGRVLAGAAFWNIVSCFDRLILKGWDYHHYESVTKAKPEMNGSTKKAGQLIDEPRYPGTRMEFGQEATRNARGIGLFWQVKNVPLFSARRPHWVPSQTAFLLKQSVSVFMSYYMHNFAIDMALRNGQHQTAANVPFLTRLMDVSPAELKTRVISTLAYWAMQFFMMQFFYSLFAILSVLANAENIKLWPPLFGSLSHAYTIRDFWGKVWHQTLRSGMEGASSFMAHDILQLPSKGFLQRYSKIIFSFMLSGVMHVVADMGGGLRAQQSGALTYFTIQPLGIMIEDGVQAMYRRFVPHTRGKTQMMIERAIGYIWVAFFFIWTSPVWIFPVNSNMRLEEGMLSWTAIKPVFVGR